MPNGGMICCHYCTYNTGIRTKEIFGNCDIFGIKASPMIICRAFREPKQSHTGARKHHPILNKLKSGIVYSIDNSGGQNSGEIMEMYHIVPIEKR